MSKHDKGWIELASYLNKKQEMNQQLTLGQLIKKLESFNLNYGDDFKKPKTVSFDFGSAIPTSTDSWRGSYSEIALGYKLTGYDVSGDQHMADITLKQLISNLKNSIGSIFEGWKGGSFKMNEDTRLWVSNPGNSGSTGITDAIDEGFRIILITGYFEY